MLNNKKKKNNKTNKTTDYIISGLLLITVAAIVYWKFKRLKLDFSGFATELAAMSAGELIAMVIELIVLVAIFLVMMYLFKKKPDTAKKVEESIVILWRKLWIPAMVLIITFLGWLHNKYQYESHFRENVTQSMCSLGNATMTIYNAGNSFQGWVWILIWGGLIWFAFDDVIDVWRTKHKQKKEVSK